MRRSPPPDHPADPGDADAAREIGRSDVPSDGRTATTGPGAGRDAYYAPDRLPSSGLTLESDAVTQTAARRSNVRLPSAT